MKLYQPGVVPSPAENMEMIAARSELWNDHGELVSDMPQMVDVLPDPTILHRVVRDNLEFAVRHEGRITVFIGEGREGLRAPITPGMDVEIVANVLTPLAMAAAVDARRFLGLFDDSPITFDAVCMTGLYTNRNGASNAHVDLVKSGISYITATNPGTIFYPGIFTHDEYLEACLNVSGLHGVTFEPGVLLRSNSLQLHKAPEIETGKAVPRGLVLLDVVLG